MKKFETLKSSKDGRPVRCLIVDDSIYARKNLSHLIETFGGQVVGEAGDGAAAVAEYDRLKPDVVLMDIIMPKMGGIDAAEIITHHNPQARVVMVSSLGDHVNIMAVLRCGARRFVQKPVQPETLYEAIQQVLGEDGKPEPMAAGTAQAQVRQ